MPQAPEEDTAYIRARISGLHEIGAVKFWFAEGSPELGVNAGKLVTGQADVTITRERYKELYGQMMARLVDNREHFRGGNSFDGIAEVVEGKHALFLFGLKDLLGAEGILLDERGAGNVSKYFRNLVGQLLVAEEVVRNLTVRLHLPDIAELDMEQIESVRRHMPAFRDRLLAAAGDEQIMFDERDAMVERLTNLLMDEFFDYIWDIRAAKRDNSGPRRVWSLLQLALPTIITRRNAARFFGWAGQDAAAPEMILMKLQMLRRAPK